MITALEPKVIATGRYNITQTCNALGICRKSLYNYTQEGRIKCGFRKATSRKFYLGSEILKFWRAQAW